MTAADPKFIVISGLIGSGKSTLAKELGEQLGYRVVYEPVAENPYLELFYKQPGKWAYPMQQWLLSRRFAAYQFAFWGLRHGEFKGVILDRSLHEDSVFAELGRDMGTIHELDWQTYLRGFQDFQTFIPEPDVYVFLDAAPEVCQQRIAARARPEEAETAFESDSEADAKSGIPLSYLRELHKGYMRWIEAVAPRLQLVRLDWNTFRPTTEAWAEVLTRYHARHRFTRSLTVPPWTQATAPTQKLGPWPMRSG